MYDTILVPTDGSEPANRAMDHAVSLADRYGSRIHALYVVELQRYGEPALSSAEIVLNELEERGTTVLDEYSERANTGGIEFDRTVTHGVPVTEILECAAEIDADLIVMGYQGLSHTKTERIGSVAERVVRDSDRPVLTI